MKQPKSQLSRYAFGYSDKKPDITYWIIQAVMVVACILAFAGVWP